MSVEEWREVFGDLAGFNSMAFVDFIGGEPSVRGDLLGTVQGAVDAGHRWQVSTNGSRLNDRTAARIASMRPVSVDVSIDGVTPATHDVGRGVAGSLDKVVRGMRALARSLARKSPSSAIRIKCTV
jgi:MoaA/NifB/PqqE/SkfB family radical SAM enzyme